MNTPHVGYQNAVGWCSTQMHSAGKARNFWVLNLITKFYRLVIVLTQRRIIKTLHTDRQTDRLNSFNISTIKYNVHNCSSKVLAYSESYMRRWQSLSHIINSPCYTVVHTSAPVPPPTKILVLRQTTFPMQQLFNSAHINYVTRLTDWLTD